MQKNLKAGRTQKRSVDQKVLLHACGLCGLAGKRLTRTECCGNLICDDDDEYVLFSYERNSCHRNHDRQTLCAFHHGEQHDGQWMECAECRAHFEPEMYAWYATNPYNFEKLKEPPPFEPTVCAGCGARIVLPLGGYSIVEGKRWCEQCDPSVSRTPRRRSKRGGV